MTGVALVLALGGCKMTIQVNTVMSRNGSGTFRVVFAIDKELADLARQSAPPGQDPFQQLTDLPAELNRSGWTLKQTTPDGGLRIEIERPFASPGELNDALAELEARTGQGGPTPSFFKDFRVTHSSGFFRNSSGISGTIDLSAEGLLGSSGIENGQALEQIVSQGASEFFEFTVRADLPGKVSTSEGEPTVSGGTVTWSPKFGQTLNFGAAARGYNPVGLSAVGVPVLLLIALGAYLIVSRRRPVAAVPGWEVGAPAPASVPPGEAETDGLEGTGAGPVAAPPSFGAGREPSDAGFTTTTGFGAPIEEESGDGPLSGAPPASPAAESPPEPEAPSEP